jgi:RNA polymerase sigma factor for flagellar operon FliA
VLAEVDRLREGMAVVDAVAYRLARRLGPHVELEELRGIGRLALIGINQSYDPSRSSFGAYAAKKLKWAIFDEVRRSTHARAAAARLNAVMASERQLEQVTDPDESGDLTGEGFQSRLTGLLEAQAAALALGLSTSRSDVMSVGDDSGSPEDATVRAQVAASVRGALSDLPERERALVERHYYGGEEFDAIAQDLGISKSWASRLHARAIASLGNALREHAPEPA